MWWAANVMVVKLKTLEERFWAKVDKSGECWVWTAGMYNGYGRISVWPRGNYELAHRLSAKWAGMDIDEKCVLHRCDTPACVNPSHLFVGTRQENNADRVAKGRCAKGGCNGRARLTMELAREIRVLRSGGMSLRGLARHFGVGQGTVRQVLDGKTWREC